MSELELAVPVQVFQLSLEFLMRDGRMRMTRREDGTLYGIFAGGVDGQELLEVAAEDAVMDVTYDVLSGLLDLRSDLDADGDGQCELLSMALEFEAVPAFTFEP